MPSRFLLLSRYRLSFVFGLCIAAACAAQAYGQSFVVPESAIRGAFAGRTGTLVIVDSASGTTSSFCLQAATERMPPCSTFKVWNTLIGLETGLISAPDQPFYKWDGQERSFADWNRDLTLKEAFGVSCVPAFQQLARRIGPAQMQLWIDRIGYGDRNTSAGIDLFWLPAKGRRTILISPVEQAELMNSMVRGKLPFSQASLGVLKELMRVVATDRGVLYGKTGSGADERGVYTLGWFVGYAECRDRTLAFACAVKGENLMGKDARAIVETLLRSQGLL